MPNETTKHSPGPWESVGANVFDGDGFLICDASQGPHISKDWHLSDAGEHWGQKPGVHYIDREDDDCERHACLIAAAPALLAFAEAHDAYMLSAGYEGPDSKALHPKAAENWRSCRIAIAKARGEG